MQYPLPPAEPEIITCRPIHLPPTRRERVLGWVVTLFAWAALVGAALAVRLHG